MIKVNFIKQVSLPGQKINYIWNNRILNAQLIKDNTIQKEEIFDLSVLNVGDEIANVETEHFSFCPLLNAKNIEGNLEVSLLYWYEGEEPELADQIIKEVTDG